MKILITENQRHLLRLVGHFSEIVEEQIEGYKLQNKGNLFWCKYYDKDGFVDNVLSVMNTLTRSFKIEKEEKGE